jgi:hypothetical protein
VKAEKVLVVWKRMIDDDTPMHRVIDQHGYENHGPGERHAARVDETIGLADDG